VGGKDSVHLSLVLSCPWGPRERSWLRHCATSRKVAGSIHDEVIGFFNQILSRKNQDSAVGIATGYVLDARGVGVRVPIGSIIFTSRSLPDRVWGPPTSCSVDTGDFFSGGEAAGA
jgi:hypothetical protein